MPNMLLKQEAPYIKDKDSIENSILETFSKKGDISVGSDIEVLWLKHQRKIDNSFSRSFYSAENDFAPSGIFGTDGRVCQGEWRITPAFDIVTFKKLTEHAFSLCKSFVLKKQSFTNSFTPDINPYGMGLYSFVGDCFDDFDESIGLHIHLGNPTLRLYAESVVAALDVFLFPVIRLFEPDVNYYVRSVCGLYGYLSDVELKPYGLEYKSLPSCIEDSDVYIGAFAIAKALAMEILDENITKDQLQEFSIESKKMYNRNYLRKMAKQSLLFLKKNCRLYYVYKDIFDTLFNKALCDNPKKFFSTGEDVFSSWGTPLIESKEVTSVLGSPYIINPGEVFKGYTPGTIDTGEVPLEITLSSAYSVTSY